MMTKIYITNIIISVLLFIMGFFHPPYAQRLGHTFVFTGLVITFGCVSYLAVSDGFYLIDNKKFTAGKATIYTTLVWLLAFLSYMGGYYIRGMVE